MIWFHSHISPFLVWEKLKTALEIGLFCWILSHFAVPELFLFLSAFIQGVRGLLMCGVTLGFFGVVLCFLGMECTYIGGADKTKDKMLLAGAAFHFAGCEYRTRIRVTVSVNDRNILPSLFLGINKTSAHRCVRYFCLLLIHQQDCQNNLCCQCRTRSLTVQFLGFFFFTLICNAVYHFV